MPTDPPDRAAVLDAAVEGMADNIAEQCWSACPACLPAVTFALTDGGRWAITYIHESGCIDVARQLISGPRPAPPDVVPTAPDPGPTTGPTDPSMTNGGDPA